MSNTWNFTIYPAPRDVDLKSDVSLALHKARCVGYEPRFPTEVMMPDGWTEVTVENDASLLSVLADRGGLVTLWSGLDEDVVFSSGKENGTLSFGALRGLMPDRDNAAAKISDDLELMFLETCASLNAWYGCSTDEWSLEGRFGSADEITNALTCHERSVREGITPYLLFWLNYFSSAYWANLDESVFADCAKVDVRTSSGVVLRTGDRPPHVAALALSRTMRFE